MDEHLWRSRWAEGRIGFHEGAPNAFLREYLGELFSGAPPPGARVLVPLAGKSADLTYLAEGGLQVLGVELVREAVDAYFRERGLAPESSRHHGFESLTAGGVRLLVGNFFDLGLPEPERCDAAYDRAALIAVRPEERERYVATLMAALRPGGRLLLVTLAAFGADIGGPPFSTTADDVARLFASHDVKLLGERDITAVETRFTERGATRVLEQAWRVIRR